MGHKIAMSGATGFVGTNLVPACKARGWDVIPLGRDDFNLPPGDLAMRMSGADTVVNLAGAPVISKWTKEYKKVLYDSRILVTRQLVDACEAMGERPKLFISTSAVGYYASGRSHTEDDFRKADDFLGDLAQDWEHEALRAKGLGIRVVIFRFGIILGKNGGALQQMLTPFKLGMGGTVGDGSQGFSWVHMKDVVRAIVSAVEDTGFEGIYNLTAPNPTTNKGLTKALADALGRPALLRVPKFVLQLQFGEGAQALTGGQQVIPKRLLEKGFTFEFTDIDTAVKDCVS